jgi:hypothetical protein
MNRPRLSASLLRVTFLRLGFILSTAIVFAPLAQASNLSAETRACLFEKPVAFGASVTQATSYVFPGYRGFVRAVEIYGSIRGSSSAASTKPALPQSSRSYGLSPIRYVAKVFAGRESVSRIRYIGSYVTSNDSQVGSAQIESLLNGDNRFLFYSSRLFVGVDAFYWDAVRDLCPTGEPQRQIRKLIANAKAKSKTLVLGNVPIESPELVRIDSERTHVGSLWYPPTPSCAHEINALLATTCTPQNNCYLIDVKSMVDHLAAGGKVAVPGHDQKEFGYYDIRPDGVHLSDLGTRFVAARIVQAFEANPPKCEPARP